MGQSLTAARMSKNHQRLSNTAKLNLVSLMDIFTILVFFLLVNSGESEVIQSNKHIKLPDSVSEQTPTNTTMVMISSEGILVGGRQVTTIDEALATKTGFITELEEELKYLSSKRVELTETEQKLGRAVTIMGDHSIPYALLKLVMGTCAKADYRNISLAVSKISGMTDTSDGEG